MDGFGRLIAVMFGTTGLVFSLLLYRTAAVRWQKEETVRSMSQMYAEHVLNEKVFCGDEWSIFREQLNRLGNYRTEIAVYERRRYEGEQGRIYLFTEEKLSDKDRLLTEGSYIRIVVSGKSKEKAVDMLYGSGSVVIAGGRVG